MTGTYKEASQRAKNVRRGIDDERPSRPRSKSPKPYRFRLEYRRNIWPEDRWVQVGRYHTEEEARHTGEKWERVLPGRKYRVVPLESVQSTAPAI